MDKRLVKRFGVMTSEDGKTTWRRVNLTDLPKVKKLITEKTRRAFGLFDIAQVITENPLTLCQVDSNDDVSVFLSFSERPTIACVAHDHWTEWFKYFYDLDNVEEYNTLFVHVILFRCGESLVRLPVLFDQVYVQMPEINNIIFIKAPEMKICTWIRVFFSILPAKNVTCHSQFGCPEIWYHVRELSINKIHLRNAQVDDFIDLRAYLGKRLDFLDRRYGEYSLAKILEFPGEGRLNIVPLNVANGLVIIHTALDYHLLDSVFELSQYEELIEFEDDEMLFDSISDTTEEVPNISVQYDLDLNTFKQFNDKTKFIMNPKKNTVQCDSNVNVSVESLSKEITANEKDFELQNLYNNEFTNNLINDFLEYHGSKFANDSVFSDTNSGTSSTIAIKLNYKKTAFMVELMLIDENEENKSSWDYFVNFFNKFPQYDFCLMNTCTTDSADLKKFFCRASLKPNCSYPMGQLFVLHRCSVFGNFTCVMVTEEHLDIMYYIIEKHPFKNIISDNISKSVFEDTKYKSYIFLCDNQPVGYCVIRLDDDMKYLSSNYDVARYLYPELARNRSAVLLNMDFKNILLKRTRCFLKHVMDASDLNCLFYKLYSNPTVMERVCIQVETGLIRLPDKILTEF